MVINTNRIIELCLVFFISILSFSIGTYVGKKYSDNQHRLSMLDPNYKHEATATTAEASNTHDTTTTTTTVEHETVPAEVNHSADTTKVAATSTNEQPVEPSLSHAISDEDVAKLSEEMEEEDQQDLAKGKPVKEIADSKSVTTVKDDRKVASIPEKAKSIAATTKDDSKYTVQVGAYPSPKEADKVVSSLKARGYEASYAEATVNGKTWYRVQVGTFITLQEAQNQKKELVEKNHLSSAIIQRINK